LKTKLEEKGRGCTSLPYSHLLTA